MSNQATLSRFAASVESLQRADSWQAWKLGERQSHPIALDTAPDTVGEVVWRALSAMAWHSGDTLAIQHSHDGSGKHTLWLFAVKASKSKGSWRDSTNGGRKVLVAGLDAKPLSMTVLAAPFAPVLPFDAFRDDPTGFDRQMVEG